MFRNYLAAALRNIVRNKLYATINIGGLAVGFAAALLIGLYVRDEFSYDRFFPGYEQIYLLGGTAGPADRPPVFVDTAPAEFAGYLKQDFPEIENVSRLSWEELSVRRVEVENTEPILWADPNFFEILKFPTVAGTLDHALEKPDSIVLTRAMARKYFGRDDPLGETIELDHKTPFTVTAVIEDLPSNVHILVSFFAAGHSSVSPLARQDAHPPGRDLFTLYAHTYLKIPDPAAAKRVEDGLSDFYFRHKAPFPAMRHELNLRPLASLHFAPLTRRDVKPRGNLAADLAMATVGLLILFAASLNFVNLMTARAARRAVEVGVRKAAGARRRDLIVQFVGEAVVYVAVSMVMGLLLAAVLLPSLNAFTDRTMSLDLLRDVRSGTFVVGLTIVVAVLAGLYPAFVLSSYRPAVALKGAIVPSHASPIMRQALVIPQFALLIGLLIATAVTYRQIQFALAEALRFDTDNVVVITQTCNGAFKDAVKSLPGVRGAVCSGNGAMGGGEHTGFASAGASDPILVEFDSVDAGFFAFYGMGPLAGSLFTTDRLYPEHSPVVLNETAARKLGFASPAAAIGQSAKLISKGYKDPSEIIGVVPDYAVDAMHTAVPPIIYYVDPFAYAPIPSFVQLIGKNFERGVLSVRLEGARTPETLREIDKLWKQHNQPTPINRTFLDRQIEARFADVTRQGQLFAVFAGVAISIALLGLFGMSAFTAERRTKEIGVRKALGASRADILRLLVWQFTKPVLWANVIAWPASYLLMQRWLEGYVRHVDLDAWVFLAASALAVIIAVITVSGHALLVARTQPVAALRYE